MSKSIHNGISNLEKEIENYESMLTNNRHQDPIQTCETLLDLKKKTICKVDMMINTCMRLKAKIRSQTGWLLFSLLK